MKKGLLISDKYKKVRGGHSRLLEIVCSKCQQPVCYYQKDGPGMLKRMYLDRIYGSNAFVNLQHNSIKFIPELVCSACKEHLGVPMIYKKEDRLAYGLFAGAVTKKIVNADKIEL